MREESLIDLVKLDKEEERAIFSAVRGGDEALMRRLVAGGMALVREIAERFVSSEVSYERLVGESASTIVEAIRSFDAASPESFVAYLTRAIEAQMRSCYGDLPRFLPIDPRVVQLHDRFELALLELYPTTSDRADERVHDEAFIADYLGVTLEELRAMKREYSISRVVPLHTPVKIDERLPDGYEDEDIDNASPLLEMVEIDAAERRATEYLDGLMECLTEEERYVVCAREGVLSTPMRTDGQIAVTLAADRRRVLALYHAAIEKMRRAGMRRG